MVPQLDTLDTELSVQENLRLERRQLRKKFETLHKDAVLG